MYLPLLPNLSLFSNSPALSHKRHTHDSKGDNSIKHNIIYMTDRNIITLIVIFGDYTWLNRQSCSFIQWLNECTRFVQSTRRLHVYPLNIAPIVIIINGFLQITYINSLARRYTNTLSVIYI